MPQPFLTPDTRRLFACLLPDTPTRHAIHSRRSDGHWPAARWWTEPARHRGRPAVLQASSSVALACRFAPTALWPLRAASAPGLHPRGQAGVAGRPMPRLPGAASPGRAVGWPGPGAVRAPAQSARHAVAPCARAAFAALGQRHRLADWRAVPGLVAVKGRRRSPPRRGVGPLPCAADAPAPAQLVLGFCGRLAVGCGVLAVRARITKPPARQAWRRPWSRIGRSRPAPRRATGARLVKFSV